MRKPKGRNRTFQSHGAGKGCADRTTDDSAYRRNFDRIKWSNKKWVTPPDEDNEMRESARGYMGDPVGELSSAGAHPIGYATWQGYYEWRDTPRKPR